MSEHKLRQRQRQSAERLLRVQQLGERLLSSVHRPIDGLCGSAADVRIDWDSLPASVDPVRGGQVSAERGQRKRYQIESFRIILDAIVGEESLRIVDFCSGSGNFGLALAALLPKERHEQLLVDDRALRGRLGLAATLERQRGRPEAPAAPRGWQAHPGLARGLAHALARMGGGGDGPLAAPAAAAVIRRRGRRREPPPLPCQPACGGDVDGGGEATAGGREDGRRRTPAALAPLAALPMGAEAERTATAAIATAAIATAAIATAAIAIAIICRYGWIRISNIWRRCRWRHVASPPSLSRSRGTSASYT